MSYRVVVGAGLSGSLLALYLARRGLSVGLFELRCERLDEKRSDRPGLNLTLCERGLRALDAVGLRDDVLKRSVAVRGRRIHDLNGNVVYQPYGNHGEAIYSIPRSSLNEVLTEVAMKEPGVDVHFNEKCIGLDFDRRVATFENTRTRVVKHVEHSQIFGADGAYSAVRTQLQRTDGFSYSQQYWRHGAYKSLRIDAPEAGKEFLKPDALHIWPRGNRMLIGFPNRDGSVTLSLLLPMTGVDSFESLQSDADVLSFFRRSFPDVVGTIPALAAQYFSQAANSLLTIKCEPWSKGSHALLIGDAAHAMLPSYGQGANAAFEDCHALDRCIGNNGDDWEATFREFETLRRPNLNAMADLCVDHFEELCELVAHSDFQKRRSIERRLSELYPARYRPLYSMITFDCGPYAEAIETAGRQQRIIDQIVQRVSSEDDLEAPAISRLLNEPGGNSSTAKESSERTAMVDSGSSASNIMNIAMRFWESKVLLSAVELGIFDALHSRRLACEDVAKACGIHQRGARDLLDSLVVLGLLRRDDGMYANMATARDYLVTESPSYIGGALELANARIYPVWGKLTDALRTGEPQNEAKVDADYYRSLTEDPRRLRTFLRGMTGLSMMASKAIARKFPWKDYESFVDLGGAEGGLAVELVSAHDHLSGTVVDLPPVEPFFDDYVQSRNVRERVSYCPGNFFNAELPTGDVFVMGHVLHNWNLREKCDLIKRAFERLPKGGALIVYEALIDDDRTSNLFGLLMSLNMLLVTRGGSVFTGAQCQQWMQEAGFGATRVEHLHGSDSMVVGLK